MLLTCLCANADVKVGACVASDADTTATNTGGTIPGMGWGNQGTGEETSSADQRVTWPTDSVQTFNLSGQKSNPQGIVIKNHKCIIIKKQ